MEDKSSSPLADDGAEGKLLKKPSSQGLGCLLLLKNTVCAVPEVGPLEMIAAVGNKAPQKQTNNKQYIYIYIYCIIINSIVLYWIFWKLKKNLLIVKEH